MNHKTFFERYGITPVEDSYTVEMLYQAIKARLVEELRTDLKSESCMARLTDITHPAQEG